MAARKSATKRSATAKARGATANRRANAPAYQRMENDERRAQLLALGRAAFAKYPYDEVSIDDLAEKAGLSKGLFYYYFPTKRDLYTAAVEVTTRELITTVVAKVAQANTPRDRAMAGVEAYLDHVERQGSSFVALMRGGIGTDSKVAGVVDKVRAQMLEQFMGGAPIGAFLKKRPLGRIAIRAWIGMVEAASVEWMTAKDIPREPLRDLLVDQLFDLLTRVLGTKVSQTEFMKP
ncbi:MAG TPA: TetR/AcrR family transcriptional regulator [Kofleriaceae bacterium]|nr:TetR/AcrR family transcriptional regulator [Kofleriaceae bacterium]